MRIRNTGARRRAGTEGARPKLRILVRLRTWALRSAAAILLAGLIAAGAFELRRSDALAIRVLVVEGTSSERADEIRALLNVKQGDNLLFADLKQARVRAESHPWVARCAVKRELPDTLRIVVEERAPKLVLALDRLYYVDTQGSPFKALQPGDLYDFPVLTGLSREDLLERADVSREAIGGALSLLAALAAPHDEGALAADEVSEIHWDAEDGYTVLTVGGKSAPVSIRFGRGDWSDKLARLREVAKAKGSGDGTPRSIDLTYASRVIVAR